LGGADLAAIVGPTDTTPNTTANQVIKGAVDYYAALSAINAAKYQAKLTKAQAQGAVAAARAGGINAAETARAGLPSPSLLIVAAAALAAVFILKK
jgi:hypothetical protein